MTFKQRFLLFILTSFTTSAYSAEIDKTHAQPPQGQITDNSQQTETLMFTPPTGWRNTDASALPEHVNIMVVGQGTHDLPPSMTLGTEIYKGSLKQYLKRIKEINRGKGYEWKDLGTIRTEAGNASLSQVDTKSQWGEIRMMHVILYKEGIIYILTAAALKDEFPTFYKEIFNSFRSLRFNKIPSNTTAYIIQK